MSSPRLPDRERQTLLNIARQSIEYGLDSSCPLPVDPADYVAALQVVGASFITLTLDGQLRGCIGALEAQLPLVQDVAEHAYAAAFRDPRFPAITREELKSLQISISILSEAKPINFSSETDLISKLQPKVDGLILEEGSHRGTFLPSVWSSLPNPRDFLRHLKQKAGLPPDYWSDSISVFRYTTESFG